MMGRQHVAQLSLPPVRVRVPLQTDGYCLQVEGDAGCSLVDMEPRLCWSSPDVWEMLGDACALGVKPGQNPVLLGRLLAALEDLHEPRQVLHGRRVESAL